MKRRPPSCGTLALLISGLTALAVSVPSPAAAEPAPTGGQRHVVEKTITTSVAMSGVRETAGQTTTRRAAGTMVALSQQDVSACLTGSTDGTTFWPDSPPVWNVTVTWWYDSDTRVTLGSSATWGGEARCHDMNFISMSSNLLFRKDSIRAGSVASCGTVSNEVNNHCGDVDSVGTWACAGIGDCDGEYHVSFERRLILPAGFSWGHSPPAGCTQLSNREAQCLWTTPAYVVPYLN